MVALLRSPTLVSVVICVRGLLRAVAGLKFSVPDRAVSSRKFPCNQTEWCAIPPGDLGYCAQPYCAAAVNKKAMKIRTRKPGRRSAAIFGKYIFLILVIYWLRPML